MRKGLVLPLILIIVGTLFLLNNLGYTNLTLGRLIATWWPAILIVAGIAMLLDRRK